MTHYVFIIWIFFAEGTARIFSKVNGIVVSYSKFSSELTFEKFHDSVYSVSSMLPSIRTCLDAFICVTWLDHMCDLPRSSVRHDSFIRVTLLVRVCDMTRSYEWHDSFVWVTWPIPMSDMTHSDVWHSYSSPFSPIKTYLYVRQNSFIGVTHSFVYMSWLIQKYAIQAPLPSHLWGGFD